MSDIHGSTHFRLYPAQQAIVDQWEQFKPRAILAAPTGAGKTLMSCAIAQNYNRILVVCPAMVRNVWSDIFGKFGRVAHPIRWGRDRKGLTKAQVAERIEAYHANIQVISYALLEEVDPFEWDLIILDEVHHLASPHAAVSKHIAHLFLGNPACHVLGLSATLIPTNVTQIWNPLRLISPPAEWPKGDPTTYGPPWAWLRKYVGLEVNDYGTVPGEPNPKQRTALAQSLVDHVMYVSLKDIMPDMPPLRLQMLECDQGKPAFDSMVKEWVQDPPGDITHQIIMCATRAQASMLAHKYHGIYIDGSVDPQKRHELLKQGEMSPHALIVATYESLMVGIRILWPQRVLLIDFNASPGEMTQLLGRFRAVGTTKRPLVQVLLQPENERVAERLQDRLRVVTSVLGSGATEQQLDELLALPEITTDVLRNALNQMNLSALELEDWESEDE